MSALKTVISTLTDRPQDIEQRYNASKTIRELYKRYGKVIKTNDFIKEIEEIEPVVGQLMELLTHHHLINNKSLDLLVRDIRSIRKKQQDITHIYVSDDNYSKELIGKVEKHFTNTKSKKLPQKALGLHIQKNEEIYKRTLDRDIKQLLS